MKIIDADGLILGRLSTHLAKLLLNGEEVAVTNAEKAVVVGNPKQIIGSYWEKRHLTHQRKGPHYPRTPHRILKRTVRGMLPYQTPRGRAAYKNLKVHIGVPRELSGRKAETVKHASSEGKTRVLSLGSISKELGAKF